MKINKYNFHEKKERKKNLIEFKMWLFWFSRMSLIFVEFVAARLELKECYKKPRHCFNSKSFTQNQKLYHLLGLSSLVPCNPLMFVVTPSIELHKALLLISPSKYLSILAAFPTLLLLLATGGKQTNHFLCNRLRLLS